MKNRFLINKRAFSIICLCAVATGCTRAPTKSNEIEQPVAWGGLSVQQHGCDVSDAKCAVVLLHGFGAAGDDLVGLANVLRSDRETCFVFPEGPIRIASNSRSWWARGEEGFENTRKQIDSLLQYIRDLNADCKIVLGGFSQGAILSCDFLDEDRESIAALILYAPSGKLRRKLTAQDLSPDGKSRPSVLIAHGREDRQLRFVDGQQFKNTLLTKGYDVTWVPFDGGHTISPQAVMRTKRFLKEIQRPSSTNN